ncbi:MAG TPA: hypothetical protein VG898_08505 [Solirubrobacterales bacterium]|nr:hypothetical protein [Solirubrobacterales bacterium]
MSAGAEHAGRGEHAIRLSEHPRALRQIELARGWGGIAAFFLVGLLALQSSLPPWSAALRALAAGAIAYVACWALALLAWRHLALAEAAAARASAEQRRNALLEEIERRGAAVPDPAQQP